MPAPIIAFGYIAVATVVGAVTGTVYGRNPTIQRDESVKEVDQLVESIDRMGELPVEAVMRTVIGLAADLCFGQSDVIAEVQRTHVEDLLELLKDYGSDSVEVSEVLRRWLAEA